MDKFKIALCQMMVDTDKKNNITKAVNMIKEAADNNAQIVALPEMFNCPYDNSFFKAYAEGLNGETISEISLAARKNNIYVVAGSIPELHAKRVYNTCFIFDRKGSIIGKHRKMHLFDIDVAGKIRFMESDILSPGNEVTIVVTEYCRIGVAICYDMRFPELLRLMSLEEAKLVIIPAAFNMTTGPAHWEPLVRVRAIDNQVYMAAVSPARNEKASYTAYGHSMVVGPWGDIVNQADEKEAIIYAEVDLNKVATVRNELPLLKHRRTDRYCITKT